MIKKERKKTSLMCVYIYVPIETGSRPVFFFRVLSRMPAILHWSIRSRQIVGALIMRPRRAVLSLRSTQLSSRRSKKQRKKRTNKRELVHSSRSTYLWTGNNTRSTATSEQRMNHGSFRGTMLGVVPALVRPAASFTWPKKKRRVVSGSGAEKSVQPFRSGSKGKNPTISL